MRVGGLWLVVAAALWVSPAAAQEAPGGFKIRIGPAPGSAPVADEAPSDEALDEAPADEGGPGDAAPAAPAPMQLEPRAVVPSPAAEAPAAAPEPPKAKPREKRRRPRAKAPRGNGPQLDGTGTAEGRRTRWGVVETVTPLDAARMLDAAGGEALEFARAIEFEHDSVQLAAGGDAALDEVTRTFQASPEVRLVLIEGHSNAPGALRYNQKLSEARASAVREALIGRGVAPERLVAFGYGETRPPTPDQPHNRRVVFRVVEADRPAMARASRGPKAATEWGQVGVVAVRGTVDGALVGAEGAADEAPDNGLPLAARAQLGEGYRIRTGPTSGVTLRAPDLSRVRVGAEAEVTLDKVFFDAAEGKAYTALRVARGTLWVMANPLERRRGRTLVSFPGGAVEGVAADFELDVQGDGRGWLRVERGTLELSSGGARSREIYAGQVVRLGMAEATPVAQLAPPSVVEPLTGRFDRPPALVWLPVPDAVGYVAEIARDVDFDDVVVRARTMEPRFDPRVLDPDTRWFWRVRAVDVSGRGGMSSAIHGFDTAPRAGPAATPEATTAAATTR